MYSSNSLPPPPPPPPPPLPLITASHLTTQKKHPKTKSLLSFLNSNNSSGPILPPPPLPPPPTTTCSKPTIILKTRTNDSKTAFLNSQKTQKNFPIPQFPLNLRSCGSGAYGRLAIGNTENQPFNFVNCKSNTENLSLKTISCGAGHILGISNQNQLYSWGKCHYGQLGLNEEDIDRWYPVIVEEVSSLKVKKIACGFSFSTLITVEGDLYSWGCGHFGPLGHGSETSFYTPQKVQTFQESTDFSTHINGEKGVTSTFNNVGLRSLFDNSYNKVHQVAAGSFHIVVLLEDGRVLSSGRNQFGQLGLGDQTNRRNLTLIPRSSFESSNSNGVSPKINFIACGEDHSVFISQNGRTFVCGDNLNKKCSNERIECFLSPFKISIPSHPKCENKLPNLGQNEGFLFAFEWHNDTISDSCTEARIQKACCGNNFTLLLDAEGNVLGFGSMVNTSILPFSNKFVSIAAGETHVLALDGNGKVYSWGNNRFGKLGRKVATKATDPIPSLSKEKVIQVDAGSNHSFALIDT